MNYIRNERVFRKFSVKNLVLLSVLSAISIILTRFLSIMLFGGAIRLGFGNVPIIFAGIILGPLAGGMTGVISDLIGVLINPMGSFHLGFTLSAALTGMMPGFITMLTKKGNAAFSIALSLIADYALIAVLLNTFWLKYLLGQAYLAILPGRVLVQGIIYATSYLIIYILVSTCKVPFPELYPFEKQP